jgi:hypothetical protein
MSLREIKERGGFARPCLSLPRSPEMLNKLLEYQNADPVAGRGGEVDMRISAGSIQKTL